MHIRNEVLEELKHALLAEKKSLEEQLSHFTKKDDRVKDDYDAQFEEMGDDEESNAEEVAEYERRLDLEGTFEVQLQQVNKALKKIEKGTYGICEKTGKEIPVKRLKAIPWAETVADVRE